MGSDVLRSFPTQITSWNMNAGKKRIDKAGQGELPVKRKQTWNSEHVTKKAFNGHSSEVRHTTLIFIGHISKFSLLHTWKAPLFQTFFLLLPEMHPWQSEGFREFSSCDSYWQSIPLTDRHKSVILPQSKTLIVVGTVFPNISCHNPLVTVLQEPCLGQAVNQFNTELLKDKRVLRH